MKMRHWRPLLARMGPPVVVAAALLAGCGGAGQNGGVAAAQSPPAVTRVDARVQPASADQARPKPKLLAAAPTPSRVYLGALAQEKIAPANSGGGPHRVGLARAAEATRTAQQTLEQLHWQPTGGGGQVAAISFLAEGARGLRLGVVIRQLPAGTMLRLYRQADRSTVLQIPGQELLQRVERKALAGDAGIDGQTWWTPDLGAHEVTLELELPAGSAQAALDIAIPRVSHIFEELSPTGARAFAPWMTKSVSCAQDANCDDTQAGQRDAVARVRFTENGDTYLCTGTLLNDSLSSGTPYFLTANHCISSQTVADTLQTDWFYRSFACNSYTLSGDATELLGGATLLYASESTDSALLLLNEAPPAGALFAGWDASPQALGSAVTGLHHSHGDLLKISLGNLLEQTSCRADGKARFQCDGTTGNYYTVKWNLGMTAAGSSGSALFNRANLVIGMLYGGQGGCFETNAFDYYGRFDVAYAAALRNWLAPPVSTTATATSSAVAAPAAAPVSKHLAVYRLYNGATGAHRFTLSADERDGIIRSEPRIADEGIAYYVQADARPGNIPAYRFYNPAGGAHFYTSSAQERDGVQRDSPNLRYEGVAWYVAPDAAPGASAVYRFYRSSSATHFYTISLPERDHVIASQPDFVYEGVAYYAWTSP
ncbi:trypsin-like serine protease [Verminephrobacter aporrectodeae]|uniref:trypsin-like serine protease n=2 Tax=Verminephrobacter aporrectodeae TaxID=1110389 RepID=UPI002238896F|nr:trypsin-like serine protease [Verminephrobacter aporrectodeae]